MIVNHKTTAIFPVDGTGVELWYGTVDGFETIVLNGRDADCYSVINNMDDALQVIQAEFPLILAKSTIIVCKNRENQWSRIRIKDGVIYEIQSLCTDDLEKAVNSVLSGIKGRLA